MSRLGLIGVWRIRAVSTSKAMPPGGGGSARPNGLLACRRRAEVDWNIMAGNSSITIRRARRDDVGVIVTMLADDPLGSARERLEDPLPPSYFRAFEALASDPHIQLVVAEDGTGFFF